MLSLEKIQKVEKKEKLQPSTCYFKLLTRRDSKMSLHLSDGVDQVPTKKPRSFYVCVFTKSINREIEKELFEQDSVQLLLLC